MEGHGSVLRGLQPPPASDSNPLQASCPHLPPPPAPPQSSTLQHPSSGSAAVRVGAKYEQQQQRGLADGTRARHHSCRDMRGRRGGGGRRLQRRIRCLGVEGVGLPPFVPTPVPRRARGGGRGAGVRDTLELKNCKGEPPPPRVQPPPLPFQVTRKTFSSALMYCAFLRVVFRV